MYNTLWKIIKNSNGGGPTCGRSRPSDLMDDSDWSCADQTASRWGERVSNPNPSIFPLSPMALSLGRASERRRSGEAARACSDECYSGSISGGWEGAPEGWRQAVCHGVGGPAWRRASDDEH